MSIRAYLVQAGQMVTVLAAILGFAYWVDTRLDAAERTIDERLDAQADLLKAAASDRFTGTCARFWALKVEKIIGTDLPDPIQSCPNPTASRFPAGLKAVN